MTDQKKLEMLCLTGCCPSCGNEESISAIEYEVEGEVWFECDKCQWNQYFSLLDAKEAGYYCSYGRQDINEKSISCLNCGGTGRFLELVEEIPTYVDCIRCEGTGQV